MPNGAETPRRITVHGRESPGAGIQSRHVSVVADAAGNHGWSGMVLRERQERTSSERDETADVSLVQ